MLLLKKEAKFRPRLLFAPKSHQNTQNEFHLQKVLPLCNQIYRGAILKFNLNLKHLRTEDETFLGAYDCKATSALCCTCIGTIRFMKADLFNQHFTF